MQLSQSLLTESLSSYKNIDEACDPQYATDYSKVNFFIGPNNSGKSRIMRSLFWDKHFSTIETGNTQVCQNIAKKMLHLLLEHNIDAIGKLSIGELRFLTSGMPILFSGNAGTLDAPLMGKLDLVNRSMDFEIEGVKKNVMHLPHVIDKWNTLASDYQKQLSVFKGEVNKVKNLGFYIPILRGTRPFVSADDDIYVARTQKDYFGGHAVKEIFGGYNIYRDVEDLLLGDLGQRDTIREYEKFLAEHFFHSEVTIIPQRKQDVLLVKIGDSKERLIHDLGDGIQAIILLTFPIFIRRNSAKIFFIEEPELNLHPSLQRKLLKCLSQEFPKHQYFLSTHSNHFLEALLEYTNTSLFSFKKSNKEDFFHLHRLTNVQNDLLENLGVKNSSVFIANCTIWVEGITDRLYIQKYLDLYIAHRAKTDGHLPLFKEDQHFAFIEYAGSNIVHWDFNSDDKERINAAFVSNNIMLIADSDFDGNGRISNKKQERFDDLQTALGKNFLLVDGKEIENLLSIQTIKRVVANYEKITTSELLFKDKISLKKKNIGEWINLSFEGLKRDFKDGNTIKDKLNFCKKAVENIKSWDDVSEDAQKMTIKIYAFIKSHNEDYI